MRVRKLDSSGDMTFGQGGKNFWRDEPDAPAQCVVTRLRLQVGEWFLNTAEGTAWKTRVLGKRTETTRDAELRVRIADTQAVSGIAVFDSNVDRETREYSLQAVIDTIYGPATIRGPF